MGWVAPRAARGGKRLAETGDEVHVAVTSVIVQMSTQFVSHVAMMQEEYM
jgi:hypothetical protein